MARRLAENKLRLLLLQILADQYDGKVRRMANGLGMSPTRLGRVIRGEPEAVRIRPEKLLRLEEIAGRQPGELLDAAGFTDLHAAIRRRFGAGVRVPRVKLTAAEQQLVDALRRLPRQQQDAIVDLVQRAARTRE